MKIIAQLVELATGHRSEVMTGNRDEFAEHLAKTELRTEAGILVLMEHNGEEWVFSHAPMMTVDTFCNHLGQSDAKILPAA